jgi:hypothetical protein
MVIPSGNFYLSYHDHVGRRYYLNSDLKFTEYSDQGCLFYFLKSDNTEIVNNDIISIHSGSLTLVIDDTNTPKLVDRNLTRAYPYNSFLINTGPEGTGSNSEIKIGNSFLLIYDMEKQMSLRFYHDIINEPSLIVDSYHNAMIIGIDFFKLELMTGNNGALALTNQEQNISPVGDEIDYKIILALILILILLLVVFALSLYHF